MYPNISVSLGLIILATAVVVMPIVRYLVLGWAAKRADIMDGQSPEARSAYFKMFSRSGSAERADRESEPDAEDEESKSERDIAQQEASQEFVRMYDRWYGRKLFYAPTLLLIAVSAILGAMVIPCGLPLLGLLDCCGMSATPDPKTIAAVAGAYMWVVNDFISRSRKLDFAPSDVLWGVLRLAIAIPMGTSIAAITAESIQPFIAFSLGAFPLATLTTVLRRLATDKLGFQETKEEADDGIVNLQGVNRQILERLANEDITTITQFAYCDPIRLTMRSNLSFNFVTDCMNQALAWVYLEDKLKDIRRFGLKGAVEIKHLVDDMEDNENKKNKARATAAFATVAETLKQTPETLMTAFREIVEDPFTVYLSEVWE